MPGLLGFIGFREKWIICEYNMISNEYITRGWTVNYSEITCHMKKETEYIFWWVVWR